MMALPRLKKWSITNARANVSFLSLPSSSLYLCSFSQPLLTTAAHIRRYPVLDQVGRYLFYPQQVPLSLFRVCARSLKLIRAKQSWETLETLKQFKGFKRVQNYQKMIDDWESLKLRLSDEEIEFYNVRLEMEKEEYANYTKVERIIAERYSLLFLFLLHTTSEPFTDQIQSQSGREFQQTRILHQNQNILSNGRAYTMISVHGNQRLTFRNSNTKSIRF